jgi:hypothetical protein
MANPTYPVTLTAGQSSVFQLDPMDTSCLYSVQNGNAAATITFDSSIDNGVKDFYSPSPALREANLSVDRSDESNVITLVAGEQYRWRVDAAQRGSYVRITCVTGSLTIVGARSGRFFMDAPAQLTLPLGVLASAAQLNILIGLMRLLLGQTALVSQPAGSTPNNQLGDKVVENYSAGLSTTLAALDP